MNNLINPYDLGASRLVEQTQSVNIDDLVRKTRKMLKKQLVEAQIEALGTSLHLTTSKTRFNGERLWFICPLCDKRAGTLYQQATSNTLGCRRCLSLYYRKQRYKGMIETG